jgi:hypothetical protein
MVAVVVTKETVAVDAQAAAMVAVVETARILLETRITASFQSGVSTAPAKHKHFKASPLTLGLAAMFR